MKTNKTKNILSVIIPIYNSMQYLSTCLDSIISQTLNDMEVICIDDGSTDNSLNILQEYALQDSRIRVFSKQNGGGGAGSARNFGLSIAKGKYIYFLDSDDYLSRIDACAIMVKHMEQDNLDLLIFNGEPDFENPSVTKNNDYYRRVYRRQRNYGYYTHGYMLLSDLVVSDEYTVVVYLQCVRRYLIVKKNLKFLEKNFHEDNAWSFTVFLVAGKSKHIPCKLMRRRVHAGSLMQKVPKFYMNFYGLYRNRKIMLTCWEQHHFPQYVNLAIQTIIANLDQSISSVFWHMNAKEKEKLFKIPAVDQYLIHFILQDPNRGTSVDENSCMIPYHMFSRHDRIVLYCADDCGTFFAQKIERDRYLILVGMISQDSARLHSTYLPIVPMERVREWVFDFVLIVVKERNDAKKILNNLVDFGVDRKKIKWIGDMHNANDIYQNYYFPMLDHMKNYYPFL